MDRAITRIISVAQGRGDVVVSALVFRSVGRWFEACFLPSGWTRNVNPHCLWRHTAGGNPGMD